METNCSLNLASNEDQISPTLETSSRSGQGKETIKNLSLHLKSFGKGEENPCKMIETLTTAPGATTLAFGLTQYNFGAVVLTLKANGDVVELVRVRYSVVGLVKEPLNSKLLGDTSIMTIARIELKSGIKVETYSKKIRGQTLNDKEKKIKNTAGNQSGDVEGKLYYNTNRADFSRGTITVEFLLKIQLMLE